MIDDTNRYIRKSLDGGTYRRTISIPKTLQQRMERHSSVNWSAVAVDAFTKMLDAIEIIEGKE